jgi:hypothetical protein
LLESLETRQLLTAIVVSNCNDSGSGSLRQAILDANSQTTPQNIEFDIPASTSANLATPVPGFDPGTQTWTINPLTPLPAITNTVTIDGFSQAASGVLFRYPSQITSAVQSVFVNGYTTGGTFTLSTSAPLPVGTTGPIPYNASPAYVLAALQGIPGMTGNVAVTNSNQTSPGLVNCLITFQGAFAGEAIPNLIADPSGLTNTSGTGFAPGVNVQTVIEGGQVLSNPTMITSVPNTTAAKNGNNAQVRVIIEGNQTVGGFGLEVDASHSVISGLAIDGFATGVKVDQPAAGTLIQGNYIGQYLTYPVDPSTGTPLPPPNNVGLGGVGNTGVGVDVYGTNTTVGGTNPQENNVIAGNGAQGVLLEAGSTGDVVEGNQIGMLGPSTNGLYFQVGNGSDGVLVEGSSDIIGGSSDAAANVISASKGDGVHIGGPTTPVTRTIVAGNIIGLAPGGGYRFGTGSPGNLGYGVEIDNSTQNQIGGPSASWGNVISSNVLDGVFIHDNSPANTVEYNLIGTTGAGSAVKGNLQDGVAVSSPQNTIGPGNVISGNLNGVDIEGATAVGTLVQANLIGTDLTGEIDLGNAQAGVLIPQNATDTVIEGDAKGSQVISGNNQGIVISGASATGNLIEGNLIGTDKTGESAMPNAQQGVYIEGASGNTIGGTTSAALNLISANDWGIQLDGVGATGNSIEGNDIGTDVSGAARLGNEIDGVVVSNGASNNTIGGTAAGAGNIIAFQVTDGVLVESGVGNSIGNSILSNSIFGNGHLGIDLVSNANDGLTAPVLTQVTSNGTITHVSLTGPANSTFLIQFFTNPDPSGQGRTNFGSAQVTTDASGNSTVTINAAFPTGEYLTATATNQTGDTSEFSQSVSESSAFWFSAATYSTTESSVVATITVTRSLTTAQASVDYETIGGGSATPGIDYLPIPISPLTFLPGVANMTFTVQILDPYTVGGSKSVVLYLPSASPGTAIDFQTYATLQIEDNDSATNLVVRNTNDSGPGSLRAAITRANQLSPTPCEISFDIPAAIDSSLSIPYQSYDPTRKALIQDFDPVTQTWTINPLTPLPAITNTVTIDGYSQGVVGVPFRYPSQSGLGIESLSLAGNPTGGFFYLQAQDSGMSKTPIGPINYDATVADVQKAMDSALGPDIVTVTSQNGTNGPLSSNPMFLTFGGPFARRLLLGLTIPLTVTVKGSTVNGDSLTGGTDPGVSLNMVSVGGSAEAAPTYIQSVPNTTPTLIGDNAQDRVIIDGSQLPSGSTGFVLDASHSILRGLDIVNFSVGVMVPALDTSNNPVVGTLIQGNFIGDYLYYPVDPISGQPLPTPNSVGFTRGEGNTQQGVVLYSSNCTVGGSNPQEANVIDGNGQQGILLMPGASGNQILGNQIGVAGPASGNIYFKDGNGADGVLIRSSGSLSDPLHIVYSSSNFVGSATGGNVISGNGGAGVHLVGVGANRNLIQGNYIGVGPGGGYPFGSGDPGNLGDGVRIEGGSQNQVGGNASNLGNTIATNRGAGVYITNITDQVTGNPDPATGNIVSFNLIGTTASGEQILGNKSDGVSIYSPSNTVGPGNVIAGNLRGIGIYGPGASNVDGTNVVPGTATDIMVYNNRIGTDETGKQGFGNAYEGVLIDGSSANTIQGDAAGSQVISGNQVGVELYGSQSTQNLVIGNLIGSDITGLLDLGNKDQGVLISGAQNNTIGGSVGSSRNLISANHFGIQLDGAGATGNTIEGNEIGTDITTAARLGNEVDGVVVSNGASSNTIGAVAAGLGNIIAFQVMTGVLVESGTGNSILSNSIHDNGRIGIDLVAPGDPPDGVTPNAPGTRVGPNDLQNYPVLSKVTSNGTITDVSGSLNSLPNTTFLIQFFVSLTPDPSGFGQGQMGFGSTQVKTDSSGNATFIVPFGAAFPSDAVLSATATNLTTGDTSEFSRDVLESSTFEFSAPSYITTESSVQATITVTRSLTTTTTSVTCATVAGGTGVPGTDYVPNSQILTFLPGVVSQTFIVQILDPHLIGGSRTVILALSNPSPAGVAAIDFQPTAMLRINDNDSGATGSFVVTNTNDSGLGSLRQAILNADAAAYPSEIYFDIPAATDNLLSVPVPGFDPVTQTWTIKPLTPLPVITQTVTIDGFTQAESGVPFRYPDQISSNVQSVTITGTPTGGTFTLSTSSPLPQGTTGPIAYNASPAQVQAALESIQGMMGNVAVTGSVGFYTIAFRGAFAGQTLPQLTANASGLTGTTPGILVATVNLGGLPISSPIMIKSVPNTTPARNGDNAQLRVIIEGNQTVGGDGLEIEASHCVISGLIIDGFDVGVSVPITTDVGNLIQGNCIGDYFLYQVDPSSGSSLGVSNSVSLAGLGNTQEGVYINANNTTIGGTNPQENNVIAGNGAQGVWIDSGGTGNVVEGNQIGMIGPSSNGLYSWAGNGADGVLVDGSSNIIGGTGSSAANVISGNGGNGVHIVGPVATRTVVGANLIGLAPGGGYLFGTGNPGNGANGVWIDSSAQNEIGGPSSSWGNAIASNAGDGVLITGSTSTTNTVAYNMIGTTSAGSSVKGNLQDGVAVSSPQNTIGPGNVISGNQRGVDIEGANAGGTFVQDNLIGTDSTGEFDLGNAREGILIQNATDAVIEGDAKGSQVISGNLQGIVINGASAIRNLIEGNLIGTDKTGQTAMPNAQEGVDIEGSPGNTVGGTTSAARNLISANHWGVRLDGSGATGNTIEGNLIGADITGKLPLGNEVNGVIVSNGASSNTIGETVAGAGAGNTIDFNVQAGIAVQSGTGNSILSNSINSNGKLGIDLVAPGDPPSGVTPDAPGVRSGPNNLQNYPILTTAVGGSTASSIQGTLNSLPNTTFLIQFFTNSLNDPSQYGQGQTLLGSTEVTTDGSGNATISYAPGTVLGSNAWFSATATNTQSGDTSEFSKSVSAVPVSVQFATSTIIVNATAGIVLVHVERVGNKNAMVSVNYATGGGTAVPGKDYTAATGTLTFLPGQIDQTFPFTILSNPSQASSSVTANMTLSQPTGGATLGSISTATLTIDNNLPPILQFNSSSYSVSATTSSVLVTVVRGGVLNATVQVGYMTSGGSAVPGTTYTPVSGILTFLPNQTTASFSVPIIPSMSATTVQTVGLALFGPTGGAQLGATSTAPLLIVPAPSYNPVGPVGPVGPVDHVSPVVTGQQLIFGAGGIVGVVISFSKPMDPTHAADLGNYGYFARIAGPDGSFSNPNDSYVALTAARYNPANATVTLIPASPLPTGRSVQITLDGLGTTLLNRGLADTSGNLLAGQNGIPGSPYVLTFVTASNKSVPTGPTGGGSKGTRHLPPPHGPSGAKFHHKAPAPPVHHRAVKPVRVVKRVARHKG